MGRYQIQWENNKFTNPDHTKKRHHTIIRCELAEATTNHHHNIQLDESINQSKAIHAKFSKLFEANHTTKNIEMKFRINPGCYPILQKATTIPYLFQKDLKNELDRVIKSGHPKRLETVKKECFVSLVVITVK